MQPPGDAAASPGGASQDHAPRFRTPMLHALLVGAISFALIVSCLWISDSVSRAVLRETVDESMVALVKLAAQHLDAQAHAKLTDPAQQNGPEYLAVVAPLRALLAAAPQYKYIYTIRDSPEGPRFGVDAAEPVDKDGDGVIDQAKLSERYPEADPYMLRALRTGSILVTPTPFQDRWGSFISAYAPVYRADGSMECIVGIDSDAAAYLERTDAMDRAALAAGLLGLAASILVGFAAYRIESRRDQMHRRLAVANENLGIAIAESIEINAQLETAKTAADAANATKSSFLANMSHEIRTPMTAILGFADVLAEQLPPGDPRRDSVSTIQRNSHHLLRLINEILDVSKIEAGGMVIERLPTDPDQVLRDVVELLEGRARQAGVQLQYRYLTVVPRCFDCDPVRLRQILTNLIGNAIKFTHAGEVGVSVRFEPSTDDRNGTLEFHIRDTGIGMTPEQVGRLFQPFVQADASTTRRFGGTGLGLSISRALARLLGGDIQVASRAGGGSTFTATIATGAVDPRALWRPALPTDARQGSLQKNAGSERKPLDGARILVAEDGPDNQRLLRHCLERAGAIVHVAADGDRALRELTIDATPDAPLRSPPIHDLILMDMQMPNIDGYTATRRLRARGCTLPIIALTAHAMAGDRERCLAAGCSEYLSKPLDLRALVEICAAALSTGCAAARRAGAD